MTDIVERLRSGEDGLEYAAADEIERLRAEAARLRETCCAQGSLIQSGVFVPNEEYGALCDERIGLRAEAARLREALLLADAALSGAHMNMSAVEKKVRTALAKEPGHE